MAHINVEDNRQLSITQTIELLHGQKAPTPVVVWSWPFAEGSVARWQKSTPFSGMPFISCRRQAPVLSVELCAKHNKEQKTAGEGATCSLLRDSSDTGVYCGC